MSSAARSLVIVRAGDQSLHPGWTTALATRDWDLVVSYYGDDPRRFRSVEERRIDDKGLKWRGLHALLERETFWRGYDHIWLPDDDLAVAQTDISALFAEMAALDLALAQPALSWQSHFSFPVTLRRPGFRARFTNIVEIMAPCFARAALETCLPTFAEVLSGWGLSWVWPRLVGADARRCAIIDAIEVTHTRPVGGPDYPWLAAEGIDASEERAATLRRYGMPNVPEATVSAAITHDGRVLDPRLLDQRIELERLLVADWNAFKSATGRGRRSAPP
jgi:hypothetical protein